MEAFLDRISFRILLPVVLHNLFPHASTVFCLPSIGVYSLILDTYVYTFSQAFGTDEEEKEKVEKELQFCDLVDECKDLLQRQSKHLHTGQLQLLHKHAALSRHHK